MKSKFEESKKGNSHVLPNFRNPNPILKQYTLEEKIGSGAFGKVYRAKNNGSSIKRAIKKIYKKRVSDYKFVLAEIDALK